MKLEKSKLKPEFKIADEFLEMKSFDNAIIEHLQEQIELREMSIEKHAKRLLKR